MLRSLLLVSVSLSLVSCTASAPKASPSWWQSLDDTEAPVEDPEVSCRGIQASNELDRLANCWPQGAPRLTPMDVAGVDEMRVELRECLLADLPAPGMEGENQARCQQGLAEVLAQRLYRLGWLRAEVTPPAAAEAGASPARPQLGVKLGQRFRIGELFVATGPSQRVNSKKIIKRAQKAIPKPRWCTETALEEIHSRVFDTSKFQAVQVSRGEPDERAGRVPIVINIQE
jgi:translocation and assembly module TamA